MIMTDEGVYDTADEEMPDAVQAQHRLRTVSRT